MNRLLLIGAMSIWCCGAVGAEPSQPFAWGVNGHPGVQEGYCQVEVAAQLDLVRDLGARWYRCDWDEGRFRSNPAAMDRLVLEAGKRGIHILPVIFPLTVARNEHTPDEIRAGSERFARSIAERYRGKITHWELDNELDGVILVHKGETCPSGKLWQWGDPTGTSRDHYEEHRYQKARAELAGLAAGLKAVDPSAKVMVDSCWIHDAWIERLIEDRVPLDILAWHWYSEMGDIHRAGGQDFLDRLRKFGKPIWITEINRRGGSLGNPQEQADYLARTARQLATSPGVQAMFVYELLDEPYFGPTNPESHYGLVELHKGAAGQWQIGQRKPAFQAIEQLIHERK